MNALVLLLAAAGSAFGWQLFADKPRAGMALAYVLRKVQRENLATLTNYGEFLAKNPVSRVPVLELDDGMKVIGPLRLSIPLYNVYLNEADEWSRRLVTSLQEWSMELQERQPEMASALAHSLAGSSGTVGAVAEILTLNGWPAGQITRAGLDWLTDKLLRAGHPDHLRLEGLKDDRRPVIGGGIGVLRALFDLFKLESLVKAEGALRQGALYDLIDRENDSTDVRERTVNWLCERYGVDQLHAARVGRIATELFAQIAAPDPSNERYSQKLVWAARLHEIGTHISHSDMHRHGAYILDHADAPGFTLQELHRMSQLVLGQRGKLRKIEDILDDELFAKQLLCLRLAVLLCHARKDPDIAPLQLSYKSRQFKLSATTGWARSFPQSAWLVEEEVAAWQKSGWRFSADLG